MQQGTDQAQGSRLSAVQQMEHLRSLPSEQLDPSLLNHLTVLKERFASICGTTIDSFQVSPFVDLLCDLV